jgi:hypothetical protein
MMALTKQTEGRRPFYQDKSVQVLAGMAGERSMQFDCGLLP